MFPLGTMIKYGHIRIFIVNSIKLANIKVIGRQLFPDQDYNWKEKTDWFEITFEIPKDEINNLDKFLEPTAKTPDIYDLILNKYPAKS